MPFIVGVLISKMEVAYNLSAKLLDTSPFYWFAVRGGEVGQAIGSLLTYLPYINKIQCQDSMLHVLFVFVTKVSECQHIFALSYIHSLHIWNA